MTNIMGGSDIDPPTDPIRLEATMSPPNLWGGSPEAKVHPSRDPVDPVFDGVSLSQACKAAEALDVLARFIHGWARSKGWWENWERPYAEQMANFHAELSEAWEEYREHHLLPEFFNYRKEDNPDKPEGITVEMMDTIVRLLDTCGRYEMKPGQAFAEKLVYNCTRPYRHGGKHA